MIPKLEIQNEKPEPLTSDPYTQKKVDEFNDALVEIYYPTVPVDVARHFLDVYPTSVEAAFDDVISIKAEEAPEGCDRGGQEMGSLGSVPDGGAVVGGGGGDPPADILGTHR